MKSYDEFCEAVRQRESSEDYGCKNAFGFLGAYQMGMARLCDLGFTVRKNPVSSSMSNTDFLFIPPLTEEKFLSATILQDCVFWLHVQNLKKRIAFKIPLPFPQIFKGTKIDLSGAIAVCHLNGFGSLVNLLNLNIDDTDGLGTRSSEYLYKFSGYEIP